jgi:hypothetical protein
MLHHLDVAIAAHGDNGNVRLESAELGGSLGTTQDRHRQVEQNQL